VGHDDEEDFSTLYLSSRARLAAQIYTLTGDSSEAAEVVQEAFTRALANWATIRSFDDREAWVRKVAFRVAVSRWRRLRRALPLGERATVASPQPVGERVDVLRAVAGLPISQRRAVVLHYLAGLSVEETATEMGAPAGTVKAWLSRARHRMAAELGDLDERPALEKEVK
jgi:RNA polymerase sigma-70 factor, ECF subfamily